MPEAIDNILAGFNSNLVYDMNHESPSVITFRSIEKMGQKTLNSRSVIFGKNRRWDGKSYERKLTIDGSVKNTA